ncbi:hypothetical protein [Solemya velesiana gill symbiont]|uniref:hypothetical protein n=1 Tax=Solemya velesiana gill symbiont TaxID=1918948 RepID=UPI0026CA699C
MGRKASPGLKRRGETWHIDKRIGGRRICFSAETTQLEEAELVLAKLIDEERQARLFGVRPIRTFDEAAAKFVLENQHKRSIHTDIGRLKNIVPVIGSLRLDRIHMGTLQQLIEYRRNKGVKTATHNHDLKLIRRIVNLAASEWIDEHGLTWLQAAPKIKLFPVRGARRPYPLTWEEQNLLFHALPSYLAQMALFAVNTGCRDNEICNLQWAWEERIRADDLDTSVFIIPDI